MTTTGNCPPAAARSAAVVNAALFVLVPFAFLTYADYTSDVVRPVARTLLSSAAYALRTLFVLFPISVFVGWRTYIHALRA